MPWISRSHLVLLVALWLTVHIFLVFHFGVRADLYDARGYISSAEFFLVHGRFEVFHQIFYAVPIILIAFFKLLPGDQLFYFVLFQCFLSGIAALCLYRAAFLVFEDGSAALFTAVIFLCWLDIIQWNTAVMTESIACSLTCLVLLKLADFRGTLKDCVVLLVLLILCALTRPTGLLIWLGAFVWLHVRRRNYFASRPALIIFGTTGFAIASFFLAWLMFNFWDFTEQYSRGNIITYMDTIEGLSLYDEGLRLDTSRLILPAPDGPPLWKMGYFIWHNPVHFGTAAILKLFYLISATRPYFSTWHNAYAVLWVSVVYIFSYFGFRHAHDMAVKFFSLAVIIVNCVLVAAATVDWDNRFYVPMQPAIVLLAGGGAAYCLRSLQAKRKSFRPQGSIKCACKTNI